MQRPRGMSLQQIADALRVTTRSARRYLREIRREFELAKDGSRPGAPLWRLSPEERPRKIELRRTQAYALLAARRLFEPMRGSALYDEIDLAIKNLVILANRPGRGPNAGLADARLEERFLHLPYAPKDYSAKTEELDVLYQAVADLRPMTFEYRDVAGQSSASAIHPYAMVLYKDAIYAVGKHLDSGELRTFALDRMTDAEFSTTERFELPADFNVDQYFQGQFGIWRGKDKLRVVVDFSPKVADYVRSRRVHPTQKLSSLRGGGVRLTMNVGDTTEVASWILGFGDTARVVEPQALRARVIRELKGALALYRERTVPPSRDS
jgi:predicted DNA-binding transcriptional regulator YafY